MGFIRFAFFSAFLLLGSTQVSTAILIAYWDMDASMVGGKLDANGGSQGGSIEGSFGVTSSGFYSEIRNVSGTDLNIVEEAGIPNQAVGFYRVGTLYESGWFRMEGFDFTGQSDVSFSFAYDSLAAFTWNTNLHVDYRIGDGNWVDFDEEQSWIDGYVVVNIAMPSALNNQSDVDLRIRTNNWLSSYGHLDIDNVQVNAVPEFSRVSFGMGVAALIAVGLRRRRKKHLH